MTTMRVRRESDEETKKEYAAFKEKVKRTVFLSELSPVSTSSDITEALSQFGDVISIEIIPNLTIPDLIPQCVLVEMKDSKQAEKVIKEITNKPFMISGMPRPVRARAAQPRMFADRPSLPGTVIEARWVGCSDPDFEMGRKMKQLCEKHTAETLELIEHTMAEEAKLAKHQTEFVKQHAKSPDGVYKKYVFTEDIKQDTSSQ